MIYIKLPWNGELYRFNIYWNFKLQTKKITLLFTYYGISMVNASVFDKVPKLRVKLIDDWNLISICNISKPNSSSFQIFLKLYTTWDKYIDLFDTCTSVLINSTSYWFFELRWPRVATNILYILQINAFISL